MLFGVTFHEQEVLVPPGGMSRVRLGLVDRPARETEGWTVEDFLVLVTPRPARVALHPGAVFVTDAEGPEGRCQGRGIDEGMGGGDRRSAQRCQGRDRGNQEETSRTHRGPS